MLTSTIILTIALVSAGITQKELDALPKPDAPDPIPAPRDFFSRKKLPAAAKSHVSPIRQQQLIIQKALRRRRSNRDRDSHPYYNPDIDALQWLDDGFRHGYLP